MYNNLKSHPFLLCIFVLVLATGCNVGGNSELKEALKKVEKLEQEANAAHEKIKRYINLESSEIVTVTLSKAQAEAVIGKAIEIETETKQIEILKADDISPLYQRITGAISIAKTKDADRATVSEQLKLLTSYTTLLEVYAYTMEVYKAYNQDPTVVDIVKEDATVVNIVEVLKQILQAQQTAVAAEGPALQQAQEALSQVKDLVKQIKIKAREDVEKELSKAVVSAEGLSKIGEVRAAVTAIAAELRKIINNQATDAPTAVEEANKAKPLLDVLHAILTVQQALQEPTTKTVEEAEAAVEEVEEAAHKVGDTIKSKIQTAAETLRAELQKKRSNLGQPAAVTRPPGATPSASPEVESQNAAIGGGQVNNKPADAEESTPDVSTQSTATDDDKGETNPADTEQSTPYVSAISTVTGGGQGEGDGASSAKPAEGLQDTVTDDGKDEGDETPPAAPAAGSKNIAPGGGQGEGHGAPPAASAAGSKNVAPGGGQGEGDGAPPAAPAAGSKNVAPGGGQGEGHGAPPAASAAGSKNVAPGGGQGKVNGNSSGSGDSIPDERVDSGGDKSGSSTGLATPQDARKGSKSAGSPFLKKPLDELTPAEIQSAVQRFKKSLSTRKIFNNTQEDILNTWNTAKASAQVGNQSLSEATGELAIAVTKVDSWVQALKSRVTPKAAKDFATLSVTTATEEATVEIRGILEQEQNKTLAACEKMRACIDLWYGNEQSTPGSGTP